MLKSSKLDITEVKIRANKKESLDLKKCHKSKILPIKYFGHNVTKKVSRKTETMLRCVTKSAI